MLNKSIENCINNAVLDAKNRKHEVVTIEHLLLAMLNDKFCIDILDYCGADINLLRHQLDSYLDTKIDSSPKSVVDPVNTVALQRVIQRVHILLFHSNETEANCGHVLMSMFREPESFGVFFLKNQNISRTDITNAMLSLDRDKPIEDPIEIKITTDSDRKSGAQKSALEQYTVNVTAKAKAGELDSLIGREAELERTILVLCRRRKNNPIYVGEPGVGKTALVEGLAIMARDKKLPPMLKDIEIFSLDLGGMLAGTKFRGDFEQRIKSVIKELKQKPGAILFIDEIHTLVGAGSTSGSSLDASNILKPFLSSGEIKCIGATTFTEYRNVFKKDSALSRRFQKIEILEPTVQETYQILKGLKSKYEEHYDITYSNAALKSAAELSNKYIHSRFLPDKAIDVMDEAGAAFLINRKNKKSSDDSQKRSVSVSDIEKIVSVIARVPTNRVNANEIEALQSLEFDLKCKIFGQDKAIKELTSSIKRNKAGLKNPDRPIGAFLLTGPTGVGKTEVCKQLSKLMGMHFERFDMSEYMEKHAVSRLIGAPPGYVGFEQGGLLTEAITKNPYSVVLFDEIEKSHPDLFNILLQIMDYGKLTDNNGHKTDFRNVIIMMTSNVGSMERHSQQVGFTKNTVNREKEAIDRMFSPEFRNRLDSIVMFDNLSPDVIGHVVDKFIDELQLLLLPKKIKLTLDSKAREWLAKNGYNNEYGARPLSRLIQTEISDKLSDEILFGQISKGGKVKISLVNDKIKLNFSTKNENDGKIKSLAYES